MRPPQRELAVRLEAALLSYDQHVRPLPGVRSAEAREAFLEQLLESMRRVSYPLVVRSRHISDRRADPSDELFDPLLAAILHQRQGNLEEAFWLVFLFVHFGKHPRAGWSYAREVYKGLDGGHRWDWPRTSADVDGFRQWLHANKDRLQSAGAPHGFGNHRKYQSLDAYSPAGTGAAVATYVAWVAPPRTHQQLMSKALDEAGGDPQVAFDRLYRSLASVASFGRTARFDYLAMVGKLALAPIQPGSTYLQGATGPLKGTRMLFGVHDSDGIRAVDLVGWLRDLDRVLGVGAQVLEDALCNWQKSPRTFRPFRA